MNQRVGMVRNNKAATGLALWAGALLLSAVALFIGFTAERASAADPAAYTVTDLGANTVADGINDHGQVTGYTRLASGYQHAFLWENGSVQDLGTLGGNYSFGYGLNNNGQVIGSSHIDDFQGNAFLWENGSMQDLGVFDWAAGSIAREINDAGQIVGHSGFGGSGTTRAFLYENGQMQDLGTLGGQWSSSSAQSINNSGQIVGHSENVSGWWHAYLHQNGSMQDLGTLGGYESQAFGINDNGQIVGRADTAGGSQHAYLYENGSMQDLGTLGGGDYSEATSINDNGQVVGTAYTDSGKPHAFVYQNGSMQDLNFLVPQDSDWEFRVAQDINDNGQIVGWGVMNGEQHGFLLTPVSSSSVDSASKQAGAGETVSTSTGDGSASASDPINTSVTTPVAGAVSIQETSVSQPETAGFSFFGQQINIEAPQASVQNPLSLRFVVDSSLVPSGTDSTSLQLFRDGVRIEACEAGASATTASPDPCVKQRSQLPDGDAAITVLSSHASAWNLAVAKPGTPLYSFKGFFQPVDKLPTVNVVKAGSAVPVRFSLGGDKGLDIFGAGYPLSGQTPSAPNAPLDQIEQTVTAGASGLSYGAASGQYTYTWKTDKAWAGQTRQLVLRLKDGTEHKASFKFTK